MRLAVKVTRENFFEVNKVLADAGLKWLTGETINEKFSTFLKVFKDYFKEECYICVDKKENVVTHARKFEEILIGNIALKKYGEEEFKFVELEELKEKMLKANVCVIELEKNGEKYYIEWAQAEEETKTLYIICTDDVREAFKFSNLEEGQNLVDKLNSKGKDKFRVKPLIENDKPVKEKEIEVDVEGILNTMNNKEVAEALKECIGALYEKIKDKK